MGNIKLRAKAAVRVSSPLAWPEGVAHADQFLLFWNAIASAVTTTEWGRRLVGGMDFTFGKGVTLHAFVPAEWDDAHATAMLTAIGEDIYQRCGTTLVEERVERIELVRNREPIVVTIDAEHFQREAAKYRRENGTSAGAVEG